MSFFGRRHQKSGKNKPAEKKEKSDLIQYIETNSTVPPTGKVIIISKGKKKVYDYFAPKPTPEILKAFVDMQKLPNVTKYYYE